MSFLKIVVDNNKRLVNTDQIIEVKLHESSLYFRMVDDTTFSIPFDHEDALTRSFDKLSRHLDAHEFPPASVYKDLGPKTLG